MENLSKKVGYLKGLMEGMAFDSASKDGKLLSGIVDLLSALAERVETMDELLDDLNDYVESIDDDLSLLERDRDDEEEFPFSDDDDDDFDDFMNAEDRLHLFKPHEDESFEDPPEDQAKQVESEDSDALAGKLCPKCSRVFFTALEDEDDATYLCPHCGERVKGIPLTPDNAPMAKPVQPD